MGPGKPAVVLSLLALAMAAGAAAGTQRGLPEGAGRATLEARCITCHESDLITQQRLTHAGWVREVDKMIRWGADLSEAEKKEIIDYLASHFGPGARSRDQSGEARGLTIFEAKCFTCHEADLVEQQRLTRAGWVREVDKMIRWGADVSDSDKDSLVDYLSRRYGVAR